VGVAEAVAAAGVGAEARGSSRATARWERLKNRIKRKGRKKRKFIGPI
jgi:hypothetical protein